MAGLSRLRKRPIAGTAASRYPLHGPVRLLDFSDGFQDPTLNCLCHVIPCPVHPDAHNFPITARHTCRPAEFAEGHFQGGGVKAASLSERLRSKLLTFEALAVRAVDLPMPFVPTRPNTCPVKQRLSCQAIPATRTLHQRAPARGVGRRWSLKLFGPVKRNSFLWQPSPQGLLHASQCGLGKIARLELANQSSYL